MSRFRLLRRSQRVALVVVSVLVVAGLALAGAIAYAATQPAIQTFTPDSADQITNLDVLRQQIRNYYGDPLGTGVFAPDSNYAKEAERSPRRAPASSRGVARSGTRRRRRRSCSMSTTPRWRPRTTRSSATGRSTRRRTHFVTSQLFPAVPGHGRHGERRPRKEGYAIIFLTGRPAAQEAATLGNLTPTASASTPAIPEPTTLSDGEDGLFTKPRRRRLPGLPEGRVRRRPQRRHAPRRTTRRRRARTSSRSATTSSRNFGDQFSDLTAASRTGPSRCRTRTTSCPEQQAGSGRGASTAPRDVVNAADRGLVSE